MNSRMERYKNYESNPHTATRSEKNKKLYESVGSVGNMELSRVRTSNNVRVIEGASKDIDIDKIKKYITSMNAKKPQKRETLFQNTKFMDNLVKTEEPRDYDLNAVLEKARKGREVDYDKERYKKIHNTEYDILSKLKIDEDVPLNKEEDITEEFNTNERTLIDLINTVTIHKDDIGLLDELKGGHENTEVIKPMKQETIKEDFKDELLKELKEELKEKEDQTKQTKITLPNNQELHKELEKTANVKPSIENNIDKSFYTNSMTFSKEDFEGFEELEKTVKKNNVLFIIGIIAIIAAIIGSLFVIANYVFDLGLF